MNDTGSAPFNLSPKFYRNFLILSWGVHLHLLHPPDFGPAKVHPGFILGGALAPVAPPLDTALPDDDIVWSTEKLEELISGVCRSFKGRAHFFSYLIFMFKRN